MQQKKKSSYVHVLYYFYLNIQAKGISEPFAFNDYRKKKIREKIEEDREDRVKPKYKLPSVNKELAKKILNDDSVCISRQMKHLYLFIDML